MAMAPVVRICAVVAALLVVAGFTMFAIDQFYEGSQNQVYKVRGDAMRAQASSEIDQPSPATEAERIRERVHTPARELVDDANDLLLAPFAGIIESKDPWGPRMVSGALALLLFGLGGMIVANALPRHRREVKDWRQATS